MFTFVLVHGAWQTSSTWELVTPKLAAAGHSVIVPKLTGLENVGHPLVASTNLSAHIEDVVACITRENLHNVFLVGHSYAGMIVTGVAESVQKRLRGLVYVDAFVPDDGQSALDLLPEPVAQMFRQQAASTGNGWLLSAGEGQLDMWGLKPGAERDFVRSRLSDFSLSCFAEAIKLPTNAASELPRAYIACVADGYPARPIFQRFAQRARQEGWQYCELPTGHDCHVEMPDAFVEALLQFAGADARA